MRSSVLMSDLLYELLSYQGACVLQTSSVVCAEDDRFSIYTYLLFFDEKGATWCFVQLLQSFFAVGPEYGRIWRLIIVLKTYVCAHEIPTTIHTFTQSFTRCIFFMNDMLCNLSTLRGSWARTYDFDIVFNSCFTFFDSSYPVRGDNDAPSDCTNSGDVRLCIKARGTADSMSVACPRSW